jgi:hypothetical protein
VEVRCDVHTGTLTLCRAFECSYVIRVSWSSTLSGC